ncbi:hypothetical protein VTI74DRAFT_8225 [Chaetomium olivicolor]
MQAIFLPPGVADHLISHITKSTTPQRRQIQPSWLWLERRVSWHRLLEWEGRRREGKSHLHHLPTLFLHPSLWKKAPQTREQTLHVCGLPHLLLEGMHLPCGCHWWAGRSFPRTHSESTDCEHPHPTNMHRDCTPLLHVGGEFLVVGRKSKVLILFYISRSGVWLTQTRESPPPPSSQKASCNRNKQTPVQDPCPSNDLIPPPHILNPQWTQPRTPGNQKGEKFIM